MPHNSTQLPRRALIAALALAISGSIGFADDAQYYVNDPLATTVAIADAAGEIAAMEADAFGAPLAIGEPPGRFTGKPYDADLGAYVFPFRNYRPEEGRWMTADPSGFPDGVNNRVSLSSVFLSVDPLGLASVNINLSDEQLGVIRIAEAAAAMAAAEIVRLANGPFERAGVYETYGSRITKQYAFDQRFNPWSMNLRAVARKTHAGFAAKDYSLKSVNQEGKNSEAYTRPLLDNTIRFRKSFFTTSADERSRIFYHEMTHIYAGTVDTEPGSYSNEPLYAHWIDDLVNYGPERLNSAILNIIRLSNHEASSE